MAVSLGRLEPGVGYSLPLPRVLVLRGNLDAALICGESQLFASLKPYKQQLQLLFPQPICPHMPRVTCLGTLNMEACGANRGMNQVACASQNSCGADTPFPVPQAGV